ncbi:MAG: hypothetical protein A2541_00685 [Candidatus Taylorbacteria bacterium RIFOXYD2_FULL_36_9]|uniref:Uncharacterized protein n=1 Tax=Candidatus Taylorbacteria bacterium RIFOXYD2_FULL_36_9 TaxID=1802338 RepID=A0A1G2PCZ0_9BACT|nr:MAG: hypothetical protein A2541_00685 [Candidatus Taylorbacteria bacterium RIFOXYD2_FULL_36_9]
MKKLILLVALLMVGVSWSVRAANIDTEEVRMRSYVTASLEDLLTNGAVYPGRITEINRWDGSEGKVVSFSERFVDGVARASVNCGVGWFRGYAAWENLAGEQIFYSQSMDPTYLSSGEQTMPFAMTVNSNRMLVLEFQEAIPSNFDEVWFGDKQVSRNGKKWQTWVYKPWNVIGQTMEVIWSGHGGWRIPIEQGSFGSTSTIVLDAGSMDGSLLAPTRLKAVSFLADGAYLEDDLITYTGLSYSDNLGCTVLEMKSLFDGEIGELALVLNGYDEDSGSMVNYFTVSLEQVEGTFSIPLGNAWTRPYTQVRVYLTDPRTGGWVWKSISDTGLWYTLGDNGRGG